MPKNNLRVSRISKKAHAHLEKTSKQTGLSFTQIIDIILGFQDTSDKKAFKQSAIGEALETPWVKDAIKTSATVKIPRKYSRVPKPDAASMDSAILICWIYNPEPEVKSRLELLSAVRLKMTQGYYPVEAASPTFINDKHTSWSAVYPEFFKDHEKAHSPFGKYFDNRIRALINNGLIIGVAIGNTAMYRLIGELDPDHRDLVWAISKISPQPGLTIPTLLAPKLH